MEGFALGVLFTYGLGVLSGLAMSDVWRRLALRPPDNKK